MESLDDRVDDRQSDPQDYLRSGSNNLAKLLDNRWLVLLGRQVDMQYFAAARRAFGETWKDIFEVVTVDGLKANYPTDAFEASQIKGPRMPHRIATGSTPEEAMGRLVDKVLGLEQSR